MMKTENNKEYIYCMYYTVIVEVNVSLAVVY